MNHADGQSFDVRIWGTRRYKGNRGTTYNVRWRVAHKSHGRTLATKKLAESSASHVPSNENHCPPTILNHRPDLLADPGLSLGSCLTAATRTQGWTGRRVGGGAAVTCDLPLCPPGALAIRVEVRTM